MKKGLKLLVSSMSLVLGTGALVGCGEVPDAPLVFEKIEFDSNAKTITKGDSITLKVTIKANKDFEEKVTWSTLNEGVIGFSEILKDSVKITAKEVGSAVVKAQIGDLTATCNITVSDIIPVYSFGGLNKRQSFRTFKSNNEGNTTNIEEKFKELNKDYVVGTDNAFNVLPEMKLYDDELNIFDNESGAITKWDKDFIYTVSKVTATGTAEAPAEDYTIQDNRAGLIKFSDSAVGNKYNIKVTAGGLDDVIAARSSSSVNYDVSVVKGYNVYTAAELSYADQRHGDGTDVQSWKEGDTVGFRPMWDAFKTAHGLKTDYNPSCLIIQDDIKVTKDDIPSTFFYSADELNGANDDKSIGSIKDTTELYLYLGLDANSTSQTDYNMNNTLKVYGNYFKIDFSAIPLVKRAWGVKTEEGKVISHCTAFRCQYGNLDFNDLKLAGNSKRAITEEDAVNAGGLIMFKATAYTNTVSSNNVISRQCFISYMGEDPAAENPNTITFNVKNCKAYDSYNSHIYNYGGILNCENSDFGMCGGPVIIADHCKFGDGEGPEAFDANTLTYETHGKVPCSYFKDCTFNNYVAGTEAWFAQMGATGLVPSIKALSDTYAPYGMTYVTDQNHNPLVVSTAAADAISMFNFICLNKCSGESLASVQKPACGTVQFSNSAKGTVDLFNYAAPDKEKVDGAKEVMTALLQAQALPADQKASAIPGLVALAQKYNVAFADTTTYSDLAPNLQAYCESVGASELTTHALLRGANGAPAPVMQNRNGFVSFNYQTSDPTGTYLLQDISNVATWTTGSPNFNPIDASHPFVASHPEYTALYYYGMMLVMGVSYIA